jgi:phosphohistidine phosphatase SixA
MTLFEGKNVIVLLMRHADREACNASSEERIQPLTNRGREDVASVAVQLSVWMGAYPPITHVLASPHRAAMDTAHQIIAALSPTLRILPEPALDPDLGNPRDPRRLAAIVHKLAQQSSDETTILIVGHQPLLGEYGRSLTGQRVSPARAGVGCIEHRGVSARLLGMIEPDLAGR